jgi:hypothetical protein
VPLRVLLGVALLLVAGALALDMSGRAPRSAGSDHVGPLVFSAAVPGGGVLCQPVQGLPGDAARAQLLIGTYGHPVPSLQVRFLDAAGADVAMGQLPSGAHEGPVWIPLRRRPRSPSATNVCLRVGGATTVVLGGEGGPITSNSELVNGHRQPGRISLIYIRRGDESWWQLLPTLARRFGLGKASFFGEWTLPLLALLLLCVWVATARLLTRELT